MYHTGEDSISGGAAKWWNIGDHIICSRGAGGRLNGVGPFSVGFYMHWHLVFINGIILKAILWTVITLTGLHLGVKICTVFTSIYPCCRFTQSFGTRAALEKICNPPMGIFCIGMVKIFELHMWFVVSISSEIPHNFVIESLSRGKRWLAFAWVMEMRTALLILALSWFWFSEAWGWG